MAEAEEEKLQNMGSATSRWQSGGRLGGANQDELDERSIFAERWERMVATLLYLPSATGRRAKSTAHSTVSFRTLDYIDPKRMHKG